MKAFGLGTCIIGIVAAMALLDPERGLGIWLEMRGDLSAAMARVERLEGQNEALRHEIRTLEQEPAALDRAIREELDLVLPGEVVVRFVTPGAGMDPLEGAPRGSVGQRPDPDIAAPHRESP